MSRKFLLISLLTIFLVVLAACGGGSSVGTPTEAPAAAEATEAPAAEEAETTEATEAEATEAPAEEATGEATEEATEEAAGESTGETAAAAGGTVIKIATQSPLSGPQSVLGVAIKNGAQLALEQASEEIAALGFTLELAPF